MPLETTMICVDNSEWMRNGDYSPSRMEAMQDSANLISSAKMQSNPENTCGIMSLAGRNPELLVSPTDDMGKIMTSIHEVKLFGRISFADGVQVAYLALKHRRNKNGGQRIVLLVGSPVTDEPQALKKVAGNLRKNNIAVDVVSIGEVEENREKLENFVKAVEKDGNSNLVTIPAGCTPSDVLISSPIVNEGMGGGGGDFPTGDFGGQAAPPAGGAGSDFGVDPNMDPELAMALRVSMEEERARQEQESASAAPPEALDAPEPLEPVPEAEPAQEPAPAAGGDDDEALLQQALALSMNDDQADGAATTEASPAMDTEGLDEEMQMALQMSMQLDEPAQTPQPTEPAAEAPPAAAAEAAPAGAAAGYDPSFVNSLLASLPGVDPSDPRIQMALAQIQAKQDAEKKDQEDKK
mmetsp:Transcript_38707/g.86435  ORF Transcript_38707/g.86435 Transcript_38707/m.86435 type:complete len:410 (-) Transcript_38707:635-1864(-)